MSRDERLLRWAGGITVALGAGHLVVLALTAGRHVGDWVDRGLWAVVPFPGQSAPPTVESLRGAVAYWSGPGGFAVPLVLLGCLVWHLGGRGVAVPAGIGWALTAWGALAGVLLGPSPFFVLVVPGALVVLAARLRRRAAEV